MRVDSGFPVDVSRETMERLREFERLVAEWTKRINLIAPSTLDVIWDRHIVDSAQVYSLADGPREWVDIGSGGGFPGIVVAIILSELRSTARVTLIESDTRKCMFLKTAVRKLGLSSEVLTARVEKVPMQGADVLSARALAPLTDLIGYAHHHLAPDGAALLMKGAKWQEELKDAKLKWSFDVDVVQSITDSEAAVLKIKNIKRN